MNEERILDLKNKIRVLNKEIEFSMIKGNSDFWEYFEKRSILEMELETLESTHKNGAW